MPSYRRAALAVAAAGLLTAASGPAAAQYFGRNKVRYRTFHFQVLKTAHFDIYYYPEERVAVEQAGRMAERWYARLSRILNHQLSARQPIILYASHPDFEQTNTLEGELGEGTGGVTEILKRRVVLPLAGPLSETDHVLGHELVHAFQFDITGHAGPVLASTACGNSAALVGMPVIGCVAPRTRETRQPMLALSESGLTIGMMLCPPLPVWNERMMLSL